MLTNRSIVEAATLGPDIDRLAAYQRALERLRIMRVSREGGIINTRRVFRVVVLLPVAMGLAYAQLIDTHTYNLMSCKLCNGRRNVPQPERISFRYGVMPLKRRGRH
jgi:hypothetical protein